MSHILQDNEGRHRLIESDYGNILKIDPGLPSDAGMSNELAFIILPFICCDYFDTILGVYTCEVSGKADAQKISITHVVKDSIEGKLFLLFS